MDMSKIYEALEQEERRRKELDRPTINVAPEGLTPVSETVQAVQEHRKTQPQLWKNEQGDHAEQDMVDLYYTISALTLHKPGQVIQFVASIPGEGASMIAEEFCRASANDLGKSVLLLKAAENVAASNHNGNEDSGLFERLMHNGTPVEDVFRKDGEKSFFVCPVKNENSVSALLSSAKVDHVFEKLREHFDLIVVDTPSVGVSASGLAMCRKADGVVLVVEAENTRLPAVENAKQKIQKAGGNILGVILNKYKSHIPGFIETHL
jgi:protein-tyrosine kinase